MSQSPSQSPGDAGHKPLAGVVVVDLTRVLAGPYCTMVLSDMGARVIKVERPGVGDDARHIGPFVEGKSAYFESINRGKESICLDLKLDDDRTIFDRLLAKADVLIENYRPGAMDRLGYGWQALHQRFPRLIYASTSGFGQTGPAKARAAYDMVVQGMGGIMSLTGHPGGPPTRVGTSVGDITAGLFTAIGIASALYERAGTGRGRRVDVAMLDCQIAILENAIARYFATGEVPGPLGARHPSITPFQAYATSDGYVIVAAGNDQLFKRLAETLGEPGLATDERFRTNAARTDNVDDLKVALEAHLLGHDTAHWLAEFDAAGVPAAPINDVAAALADPQVAARHMVRDIDGIRLKVAGNPIKLDGMAEPDSFAPASGLDADRDSVLAWLDDDSGQS